MRVLLVASGSGGHLLPALNTLEVLEKRHTCTVMSTARAVEQKLQSSTGAAWVNVDLKPMTPLHRWFNKDYRTHQVEAMKHIWQSVQTIQPDIVVGFGGYLSFMVMLAVKKLNIPLIIHEQNLIPGKANKVLAYVVNHVAVSFAGTEQKLTSACHVVHTGNPTRQKLQATTREDAREALGLDPSHPVLLVMGGSQGAHNINKVVLELFENYREQLPTNLQVIHLTGLHDEHSIRTQYSQLGVNAQVFGFYKQMEWPLKAADVCISRAGATGIAEILAARLPSIFIPYPHAGKHQWANACWMRDAVDAKVFKESSLTTQQLVQSLESCLDPECNQQLRERMAEVFLTSVDQTLPDLIEHTLKTHKEAS